MAQGEEEHSELGHFPLDAARRAKTPQGQAHGLNKPGKGTGGEGLASDRPQQLASPSSPRPESSAACLSPASFPGEGRSHLELHLAFRPTELREDGCCGQRPGSNPGQGSTNQWGSLPAHRSQGASGKAQEAPLLRGGAALCRPPNPGRRGAGPSSHSALELVGPSRSTGRIWTGRWRSLQGRAHQARTHQART